jgi:hypothetical protein
MLTRQDFKKSQQVAPWRHALQSLLGLAFAYLLYGGSLFVVAVGHMNPNKTAVYEWLSVLGQFFPLVLSALCWLLFLWSYRKKWLLLALGLWGWVVLSIPLLNYWQHH